LEEIKTLEAISLFGGPAQITIKTSNSPSDKNADFDLVLFLMSRGMFIHYRNSLI
jgi:hypothetical protein